MLWGFACRSILPALLLSPLALFLVILLRSAWRILARCRATTVITVCGKFSALPWSSSRDCRICCLHALSCINNIQLQSLHLLLCEGTSWGSSFWRAVWYTNKSSFMSFLLMKPHLSYTIPQTYWAKTFLSA